MLKEIMCLYSRWLVLERDALIFYLIKGYSVGKDKLGSGVARTPDNSSDMRIGLLNLRSWCSCSLIVLSKRHSCPCVRHEGMWRMQV